MRFSTLSGLIAAAAVSVQAIATIHSKGSKFFDSDGNQFYIKGMFFSRLFTPSISIARLDLQAMGKCMY